MEKDLDYYMNLNWTLIEGEDLDFEGNPYHYKKQLKLQLMIMLEDGDEIKEPGDDEDEDLDWENLCPGG